MIPNRYTWLLRDVETLFDDDLGRGHACRVCRALERGETRLRPGHLESHRARHLVEKVTQDADPEYEKIMQAIA